MWSNHMLFVYKILVEYSGNEYSSYYWHNVNGNITKFKTNPVYTLEEYFEQ
jgi:hypothetical protein